MNRDAWRAAGEAHLAQGRLRRALGAFRRAVEVDERGEQSFALHQLTSVATQVLSQRGAFFLHPDDETVRSRWLEAGAPPLAAPDFEALGREARARGETTLEALFTTRRLSAGMAGQVLGKDEQSQAAVLWLYEQLLQQEEPLTSG